MKFTVKLAIAACLAAGAAAAQDEGQPSFFVTSTGLGQGGNLGGLEGADAHCQSLAEAAGLQGTAWRAYLSTQGDDAVNARDRIGSGPWYNVEGVLIAQDLDQLHNEEGINVTHETALDENGASVPYVGLDEEGNPLQPGQNPVEPVEHDILTGSQANGTAFPADAGDMTCSNWTSSDEGSAMLGHHDRRSLQPGLSPWNTAHPSTGCGQEALVQTGGAGRLYCFLAE